MAAALLLTSWAAAEPGVVVPDHAQQSVETENAAPIHTSIRERLRRWFHHNDSAPVGATQVDRRYLPMPTGIAGHSALPGLLPVNLSGNNGW
jgi:hypothetical protein